MTGPADRPSSPLAAFAAANDAAAATTKKLAKQSALAGYLRSLSDDDLALAARFASGSPFAATDERVLGVSGAAVSAVIMEMFGLDGSEWGDLLRRNGEVGEAMAQLWQERVDPRDPERFDPVHSPPLSLTDLQETWDTLARVGQQEAKRDLLRDLFARVRTAREAAYAGKIIFGDLRTGVREGVLHAAVAEAFDRDLAAVRRAMLLLGDVGEVAVLARHDRLAEARFKLFHPIGFMLAGVVETPAEAAEAIGKGAATGAPGTAPPETARAAKPWLAEHKFDGIRAQVHRAPDDQGGVRVAIYTRTMDRVDESFPEVVAQAAEVEGEWLLDGEIVPYDAEAGVVLPFAMLQKRLGRKAPGPDVLEHYPCRFVAFDLLYVDGQVQLDQPLHERRAALARLLSDQDGVLLSAASPVRTVEEVELAFDEARRSRNEGLVMKDPDSLYTPGRRGGAWIKLKTHLPTLDVVVTAAEHGHGKRRDVLSDYTFAVWDRAPAEDGAQLVNVGKAFSGVTDAEIDQLTELFLSIQTGVHDGRYYTVRPQVVLEVAFDAIQKSERHASGFALRFPRIKRIRWDRAPETADRIERVREIFEHEQNFNRNEVRPEPAPRGRQSTAREHGQLNLFEEREK